MFAELQVEKRVEEGRKKQFVNDYLKPILTAVLIALFIRTFVVQAFRIPSSSMEPTLLVGDYLLVNKFIYGVGIPFKDVKFFQFVKPKRGDIIVFPFPKDPSKDFIKRVIGTEGEKVQIIDSRIYIDDQLIVDLWGHFGTIGSVEYRNAVENFGPVVVPKDCLFVMGDNRNNSEDSRFWGFLRVETVLGKALVIYFSWNGRAPDLLDKVRWNRMGEVIR